MPTYFVLDFLQTKAAPPRGKGEGELPYETDGDARRLA